MFNYSKLKGRIKEKFGNQVKYAKHLGIATSTITNLLNNKSKFNQDKILEWCEELEISKEEITEYFFKIQV